MIVAIVDYGSGNLRSAAKAFERTARENEIRAEVKVTSAPEAVAMADRIVLPGVGAFADCRRGLMALPCLETALHEAVMIRARPFLGICVGMQLLADAGREFETVRQVGSRPGVSDECSRRFAQREVRRVSSSRFLPPLGLPFSITVLRYGRRIRPSVSRQILKRSTPAASITISLCPSQKDFSAILAPDSC